MTNTDGVVLNETPLPGGMFRLAPEGIERPRHLTPPEKIALGRKNDLLAAKAESRQAECWLWNCKRPASVWVREVSFDFKGGRAEPEQHAAVSSADYPGPVPGFCHGCLGHGPAELAQTVYFARPEMFWGVRPNRWFVSFTDGTRQGGEAVEIDPRQAAPAFTVGPA
jgi:hypothetical protein